MNGEPLPPQMTGIRLEAQDMLKPLNDSICIFGGDKRRFQEMMVIMHAAEDHEFIFGSSIWFLPARTTENTTASASILEVKLAIVGRQDAHREINRAIGIILQPFHLWTWLLILFSLILAIVSYLALAWYFAIPRDGMNVCSHLLLNFSHSRTQDEEREHMLNVVAVRALIFLP